MTCMNDRLAFQLTIALAAVAIALGSATAADDLNGNTNSVGAESCKCVPFYQCGSEDAVNIPLSTTTVGCLAGWVCCRSEPRDTTEGTIRGTEPPPDNFQQGHGVDDQEQCTCVPKNQCSIDDNSTAYNARAGNCSSYDQVCCNTNNIVGGTNENNNNNNNNARSCGVGIPSQVNEIDSRIFSSSDDVTSKTHLGQFPWMVAVMRVHIDQYGKRTNDFLYLCGGSLIHPQVVLTAAHCVKGLKLDDLKMRVGEWDTLSNSPTEQNHQDISVSDVVIHPYFNNGSMHNDVALVKLSSEAVLHQHVNTICIPNPTQKLNYDSKSCVVTGWGKNAFDKNGQYQNVLKATYVSLVPHDECQQKLKRTRLGNHFILDKSFVCAGGVIRQDACDGDGGGPLICDTGNGYASSSLKKYIQVGIVSWGIGCGSENVPGVYSSVDANSEWINQMLGTFTR